ncbi:unnamed protein product [Scytosiphon promiscuus]
MNAHPKRALLEGIEAEVFKLVSHGASQEQWAEWLRAPLEHAAAQGNLDLVSKLVEAGADGSAGWKGCGGRTLLHAAASGGDEGVISILLRQGSQPDVNVLSSPVGRSALYEAVTCGHDAAARLLILAGADGVVSALLLRGADKDAVDVRGHTALIDAAGSGCLTVVEALLAAGADFTLRSSGSPAYSALDFAAQEGRAPILQALVQGGMDADARGESGDTALHVAAFSGQASSIDALIEVGANMEAKCDEGGTPLDRAAMSGMSEAVLALLRHGASLGVRDNFGMTPLHSACDQQPKGLLSVVDLLLRWDADETISDDDGEKPSDLLDSAHEDRDCSEDEIKRALVLLARAPADRAWRRRGWLVMLRARSRKERDTGRDQQRRMADTARSMAGCEGVGDVPGKATTRSVARGDIEGRDLGGAVALLTELQPECVFRSILAFLG